MINELPGDVRRQAVSSIRGTVYQAWCSIDSWLRIEEAKVIYLEGAEDFDVVSSEDAITVQVRNTSGPISLNASKALSALRNFWELSSRESQKKIEYHYLTTSTIALEHDADFDGLNGIEFWRIAKTNKDFATVLGAYLARKVDHKSSLGHFLRTAKGEDIQARLIRRFHWFTDQPDLEIVKRSVDDRITELLDRRQISTSLVPNVRIALESRFWELIVKSDSSQRALTYGELLRLIETATTAYLPIRLDKIPDLLGSTRSGVGLLKLLLNKAPNPPDLLLDRHTLQAQIEELLSQRKSVLLTGTVHKGKTTLAKIVSTYLCPEAWWIELSGRRNDQIDDVLLALADEIERDSCPNLVIIDDLDTSLAAQRVYGNSLKLTLHRAFESGRGVLITARGDADNTSVLMGDYKNIEVIDIPKMGAEEISGLCVKKGCLQEDAEIWGSLIAAMTGGHPKLVQVRLSELKDQNWPSPSPEDITKQSSATASIRQITRQLLVDTTPEPAVDFVYLISACSILMHRSVALKLAESVIGLRGGGDALDSLAGSWIERIGGEYFQATALLKGAIADVWSESKQKWAHICLFDAIQSKGTLAPVEAAALLFHAFLSKDAKRTAMTAARLQLIEDDQAQREVEKQLLWLPYVALEPRQEITEDPFADSSMRMLQFRVAARLDSDCLPKICRRWIETNEKLSKLPDEARNLLDSMMWLCISTEFNNKVPIVWRLKGILELHTSDVEEIQLEENVRKSFFKNGEASEELPEDGTVIQILLMCANRSIRSLEDLAILLNWLVVEATDEIRRDFDEMLEWPLIQSLGAFVLNAYVACYEKTTDWEPWLKFFEGALNHSKALRLNRFGREIAKANAIILTEHLSRSDDALQVLASAEKNFGTSFVLMEQRANVLYHAKDDTSVLSLWDQMSSDPNIKKSLDPFAYRRAGISAGRLKQWLKAGKIYLEGSASIPNNFLQLTKFGLSVDAALAFARGGDLRLAATVLADAAMVLPCAASEEGQEQWDMVQRLSVRVCRIIDDSIWKNCQDDYQLASGFASSPDIKNPDLEPGQEMRHQMAKAETLFHAILLAKNPSKYAQAMDSLAETKYSLVKLKVVEGRIVNAISVGAGEGFVSILLDFEEFFSRRLHLMQQGKNPLELDTGNFDELQRNPHSWFGFVCAAAVSAGKDVNTVLPLWIKEAKSLLGKDAILVEMLSLMFEGISQPSSELWSTLANVNSSAPIRSGAAIRLLQEDLTGRDLIQVHCFLASVMIGDHSSARQQLFNLSVARCFSNSWRLQALKAFQFYSPRTSIPKLASAIDKVEGGSGTLKTLLGGAAAALNHPQGQLMGHLL